MPFSFDWIKDVGYNATAHCVERMRFFRGFFMYTPLPKQGTFKMAINASVSCFHAGEDLRSRWLINFEVWRDCVCLYQVNLLRVAVLVVHLRGCFILVADKLLLEIRLALLH